MRQRGLSSRSRRPQVKKASPDRPSSIVVNGEGEEDAPLAESVRSADWEIVADDSEDDDSDGVVIDVENQNADRTEASDSTAMETNLAPCFVDGVTLTTVRKMTRCSLNLRSWASEAKSAGITAGVIRLRRLSSGHFIPERLILEASTWFQAVTVSQGR
ncbi:uncharacterized protein LOC120289430 isoform X2 [Eucalyptus grandis]|uniref:uncharacterized protein LOC120289430 isoform X2 n=1 Tax=Eucalyptus grandis TaxID=71139 RepID=UPI00192EDB99|nr:uncharacterized protein LOC120289430 isoform X2 [Eucalyptus grandis]